MECCRLPEFRPAFAYIPANDPSRAKKLLYAEANFEEMQDEGYRFADKTAYIRALEVYEVPVFLRLRRFGKTLWCSTLECYYEILRNRPLRDRGS